MSQLWDKSFVAQEQDCAYNLAPPETLVRHVNYYLRARYKPEEYKWLRFLDMGCGAGSTLLWLAKLGVHATGIDISEKAVELARLRIEPLQWEGQKPRVSVICCPATECPFDDARFDGILTANVLQHLDKADRKKAFAEITRLLKPGGLFVCYEMASDSWFGFAEDAPIIEEDPGTLVFHNSDLKDYLLGNIGLTHFFSKGEILDGLKGFTTVDICPVVYKIPSEESERRGYKPGTQMTFWASYAIR